MDGRSEGTPENSTKRSLYIFCVAQHQGLLTDLMWHRPGDTNRHGPRWCPTSNICFLCRWGSSCKKGVEAWQTLVHVCQRWRGVVFGSPRRLNLRLFCTTETPVRDTLDVWPPLPLLIHGSDYPTPGVDNIIAALERSDRVCQITLEYVPSSQLGEVWAAMQEPFPELTHFQLRALDEPAPVVPDSFLGGSAPCLQYHWDGIPFPGLPKLLLSATHLVTLQIWNIPYSGYLSPETMATRLSALTSLETLWLGFQSPLSRPGRESRRPPPTTRTVLPALSDFWFKGVSEYLEVLVARIDAPRLKNLDITFFHQLVFGTPQFVQFISRLPWLKAPNEARLTFYDRAVRVRLPSQTFDYGDFNVGISCRESDWQLSSLAQLCNSSLPLLSTVEYLFIHKPQHLQLDWQDDIDITQWVELLHPFIAVKHIYLSKEFVPHIASSLQEIVRGRMAEVLPALQNLFLEELQPSGRVHEGIGQFVAARQLSGHPIAVSCWERTW
jgi:hypothetical protein